MKYEKFRNFKNFTIDNFEDEKRSRLNKWLTDYQSRLIYEYENRNTIKSIIDKKNIFDIPISRNAHNNLLSKNLDYKNVTDFHLIKKSYMNRLNPKFILRNHIAQRAIEKAEQGKDEELWKVFKIMTTPFDEHDDIIFEGEYDTSTILAYNICVSCSS
jgi:uncharacterized protein YdiU (UPF0061 family)